MALTVATAQEKVARLLGEYAGLVDLPDLVGVSVRACGIAQADLSAVADDDLATITSVQLNQFYDVAYAEGLDRILANLDPLALRRIGIEEDPAVIAARLTRLLVSVRGRLKDSYGYGLQPLVGGVWTFDFAQRGDEDNGGEF